MKLTKSTVSPADQREMNIAIRLSFLVGLFMLVLKCYAYMITDSTAIMSDAAESIIHVFAVGFAAFSLWFSLKPADDNHQYGHEKIGFFSAGFEGAMIIVAACLIYWESAHKILYGVELHNLDAGLIFIFIAIVVNLLLGFFLISRGKKHKSIVLEANGKHILTDCLTSVSVVIALVLVKVTGNSLFDPIVAVLAATNILWTGWKLISKCISGLMDQTDPSLHQKMAKFLKEETVKRNMEFHHLRHRLAGSRVFVEFHLLFANDINLGRAHEIASEIEALLQDVLDNPVEISSHLELKEHHDHIHEKFGLPI